MSESPESVTIAREIYDSSQRLHDGSQKLFGLAKKWAEAERDYRRALAVEILLLKDQKMPATLIPDLARGNCSELKFQRDLAEATYKSGRDALEAIRSQMNGLQTIVKFQKEIQE